MHLANSGQENTKNMDIILNDSLINQIDLTKLQSFLGPTQNEPLLKGPDKGFNYYKTLAYFSTLFENSTIFDIGSGHGHSALALSYNESNKIISFDVNRSREIQIIGRQNIQYLLENALKHSDILKCPLIYLDVNHTGDFEKEIIDFLWDNEWKGLLVLDDIFDYHGLMMLWESIVIPKYNITEYGHFSGFGIIDFAEEGINKIILQK